MNLLEKVAINRKDLLIYEKNKLVVIYSKKTASHVILSEEVYRFIEIASNENITIKEFIQAFQDDDDKKYMEKILINLQKIGALYNGSYEQVIYQKNYEKKSIYICLTKKCNLKCKHCCSSCGNEEEDFFNTKQIKHIIDIVKDLGSNVIVLTGGEPLIRNDFQEIVNYIKQNLENVSLVLSTNGTLINDKNIDFIVKNFRKIDISLDGVDEKTCSLVRGKGVFTKVLSVVKSLQDRNFNNIHLSMVFGEKNAYLKERFKELNESLKTTSVERYFIPQGRGADNVLEYNSEDTMLPISIARYFDNNKDKRSKNISSCACDALKSQLFINYDGNIYPCPSLIEEDYRVGSIFDLDVITSIQSNKLDKMCAYRNLQDIYPYNFEKCMNCDVNIFCWHCPALLNSVKDNDKDLTRWCSLMKPNLNRIIWDEEVM